MTQTINNLNSSSNLQDVPHVRSPRRCTHRTKTGRQCKLPVIDSASGLCFRHAQLHRGPHDSEDLSADLLQGLAGKDEFASSDDVNNFIGALLILQVKGRVSVRRGAVLCYMAGQLNRGLREAERNAPPEQIVIDIDSAVARRARGEFDPQPEPVAPAAT